jgi:hypothetical protein
MSADAHKCESCGIPMKLENALYHPETGEVVMAEYSYQCECNPPIYPPPEPDFSWAKGYEKLAHLFPHDDDDIPF